MDSQKIKNLEYVMCNFTGTEEYSKMFGSSKHIKRFIGSIGSRPYDFNRNNDIKVETTREKKI